MNRRRLLAIGALSISAAGCSGNTPDESNESPNTATLTSTDTGQNDETATGHSTATQASPSIAVTAIDTPDQLQHYQPASIEVVLENQGDTSGRFQDRITSNQLLEPIPISATVPAGQRKRVTSEIPYPENIERSQLELGDIEVPFTLAQRSFTITYTSPTLELGESMRFPEWAKLGVLEARKIESFEVKIGGGRTRERTPEGDYEFFLALRITTTNLADDGARPPSMSGWSLRDADGNYHRVGQFPSGTTDIVQPFSGKRSSGPFAPGQPNTSWGFVQVHYVPEDGAIVHANQKYPNLMPAWNL